MQRYSTTVHADDFLRGGLLLWRIQSRERLYNGRYKLIGIQLAAIVIGALINPWAGIALSLLIPLLFLIDYIIDYRKYRMLTATDAGSMPHTLYFDEDGFMHRPEKWADATAYNKHYWSTFDYTIEALEAGVLYFIDHDGGVIFLCKSWMLAEAFAEVVRISRRYVGRSLHPRHV